MTTSRTAQPSRAKPDDLVLVITPILSAKSLAKRVGRLSKRYLWSNLRAGDCGRYASEPKLITRPQHRLRRRVDLDFDHFFALNCGSSFVGQAADNLPAGNIDDVSRGGIRESSVEAECDPARFITDLDTVDQPGRDERRVENVHLLVECITDPNLGLVWGQSNPIFPASSRPAVGIRLTKRWP